MSNTFGLTSHHDVSDIVDAIPHYTYAYDRHKDICRPVIQQVLKDKLYAQPHDEYNGSADIYPALIYKRLNGKIYKPCKDVIISHTYIITRLARKIKQRYTGKKPCIKIAIPNSSGLHERRFVAAH